LFQKKTPRAKKNSNKQLEARQNKQIDTEMPYQVFNSVSPVETTDSQFLDWIQDIQTKYIEGAASGRRSGFSFTVGSGNCAIMGDLLDRAHMRKYVTSQTRRLEFDGFIDRLEEFLKTNGGGSVKTESNVPWRTIVGELVITEQPPSQPYSQAYSPFSQPAAQEDLFFGS
jgi:hypothetical protein